MSEIHYDLLVQNIGRLYSLNVGGEGPLRGDDLMEVGIVEDAILAVDAGIIVAAGASAQLSQHLRPKPGARVLDARGQALIPGLVDAHTHALFAEPRPAEFGRRLRGESYMDIARSGGGIKSSVRSFRALKTPELERRGLERAASCLAYGTTTLEIKSGYGLNHDEELRASRIIHALVGRKDLPHLVTTTLAAHEFAEEWKDDREGWIEEICTRTLPQIAAEGLAERVDAFCEPGVLTVDQARRVLEAGQALGLRAVLHADELEASGGAELAVSLGADSADHLGAISEAGIDALSSSDCVGILLPATIFSLGLDQFAPARKMIEANCALALASDFNPGSNYCQSLPLVMAIGCTRMKLHPHEALAMCTRNAAFSLGRDSVAGRLAVGRPADFALLRCGTIDELCQHLGLDEIESTWVDGHCLWAANGAESPSSA